MEDSPGHLLSPAHVDSHASLWLRGLPDSWPMTHVTALWLPEKINFLLICVPVALCRELCSYLIMSSYSCFLHFCLCRLWTPPSQGLCFLVCVCVCALMLSCVRFFAILWTVAHQAPLVREFSPKEYWSGLPFPPSKGSSWPRDWTCDSFVDR